MYYNNSVPMFLYFYLDDRSLGKSGVLNSSTAVELELVICVLSCRGMLNWSWSVSLGPVVCFLDVRRSPRVQRRCLGL